MIRYWSNGCGSISENFATAIFGEEYVHYTMKNMSTTPWRICPLHHEEYVHYTMKNMSTTPWRICPLHHEEYVHYTMKNMSTTPWRICPLHHEEYVHYTMKIETETSLATPVPISDVPCYTMKLTQAFPFLRCQQNCFHDLCSRRMSWPILQVRVQNLVQIYKYSRGAQNLGARSPRRLNFVGWGLIFLGLQ